MYYNYDYFEIDEEIINQLPKFSGAFGEDPTYYLRDLHHVCSAIKPRGVDVDEFKFKVLPFSLIDDAKIWYSFINLRVIRTWDRILHLFLYKYSLEAEEDQIRETITSIEQYSNETTHEYLERFEDLMRRFPNHGLHEYTLIMSFLNGMVRTERRLLDVMAGGSIMDCYPEDVWDIIYERADNTRPYELLETTDISQQEEVINIHTEATDTLPEHSKVVPETESVVQEEDSDLEESPPQPTPHSLDDIQLTMPTSDEEKENNMQDEASLAVPSECIGDLDVHAKELMSPQCSDIIIEQSTVSSISLALSLTTNALLSSHMQYHIVHEALDNKKVWGSLGKVNVQFSQAYTRKQMLNYRRSLDKACKNWKSRKKTKHMAFKEGVSKFLRPKRRRNSTFGWKPGWSLYTCARIKRNVRARWRKFDGTHPWAPNI